MPIDILFGNISVISGFVPVIVAAVNYRQLDKVLRLLALYLLFSVLVDIDLWLSLNIFKVKNTMPILHVFVMISVILLGIVYYYMYSNNYLKRISIILTISTAVISIFYARNMLLYPSIPITALGILLIIFSLIYFYQMLYPHEYVPLEKQSLFWINAGILFYSGVNIFLFMLLNQIPAQHRANYYIIHNVTNIIANILYSIGLFRKPKQLA